MYQEVVISTSTLNYLRNNYHQFDSSSIGALLMRRLGDDVLCLDTNRKLDEKLEEKIYEIGDDILFNLWTHFIDKGIGSFKRYEVNYYGATKGLLEYELASKTKDKIFIDDELSKDEKKNVKKILGNIPTMVITHEQYLYPSKKIPIVYDGLLHRLKPKEKFKWKKFLEILFRKSKNIIITDGYIVNPKASKNLIELIGLTDSNVNIEILTLDDRERIGKNFSNFEIQEKLKNKFPDHKIKFNKNFKKYLKDRWIETDTVIINMGHGLNEFDGDKVAGDTSFFVKKKNP